MNSMKIVPLDKSELLPEIKYVPWLCTAPIKSQIYQNDYLIIGEDGCAVQARTIAEYNEFGVGMSIETTIKGQKYVNFIQESTTIIIN